MYSLSDFYLRVLIVLRVFGLFCFQFLNFTIFVLIHNAVRNLIHQEG